MSKKPKNSAKTAGRCIFCGGTGLSKEHIWSEWIQKLIPPNHEHGEYWAGMHRDSGSTEIQWSEPPRSKSRQGCVLQRRVRNVCERNCNNGWMSRVVNRAKPHVERMILCQAFELSRQDQRDLAAWIGITTIIQEFANRRGARKIPAEDRAHLMNSEAPPLDWTIWIASYVGQWWAPMEHYHIPMSYTKSPSETEHDPPRSDLQLTTFTLGGLLVHVFTSTQSAMIEQYRSYIGAASNSAKLKQLWPIADETMSWPPRSAFRDEEVDRLAFNWIENKWGVHGLPGQAEIRRILDAAQVLAMLIARRDA